MGTSHREKMAKVAELNSALQTLLDHDHIEGEAAKGIAKQVIGKGLDSLTDKQRAIFDNKVMTIIPTECDMCEGQFSDLEEAIVALEDDGYCYSCRNKMEDDE